MQTIGFLGWCFVCVYIWSSAMCFCEVWFLRYGYFQIKKGPLIVGTEYNCRSPCDACYTTTMISNMWQVWFIMICCYLTTTVWFNTSPVYINFLIGHIFLDNLSDSHWGPPAYWVWESVSPDTVTLRPPRDGERTVPQEQWRPKEEICPQHSSSECVHQDRWQQSGDLIS